MNPEDADYGTDPFTLTRYLKNHCHICPKCRKECSFTADFDREREVIDLVADCDPCGKTVLVPTLGQNGDLSIYIGDSDELYEPDKECFDLKKELSNKEVKGSKKDDLGLFTRLARAYSESHRISASVDLSELIAEEYRDHIGEEGWDDALTECINTVTGTYNILSGIEDSKRASELLEKYLPLTENNDSDVCLRLRYLYGESLAESDPNRSVRYLRELIDRLESLKRNGNGPDLLPIYLFKAYESLGMSLFARNEPDKAVKSLKNAFDEIYAIIGAASDSLLMEFIRVTYEYSTVCVLCNKQKRGVEAAKICVKTCSEHRSESPVAYAAAVEGRVKLFLSTSMKPLPSFSDELTESIKLLNECDNPDRYAHLVTAYFLRSAVNRPEGELDRDDAEEGYRILREGLSNGDIPESVAVSTMNIYVAHLDAKKDPRATEIRKELEKMGIWLMAPLGHAGMN